MKVLVVGHSDTGKTSIIQRYVNDYFSKFYKTTIGVDFALKTLQWDDDTMIYLQLWDIAGQERVQNMTRVYYKEAVAAFVVFDASNLKSLDIAIKWKDDIDKKVTIPGTGEPIPVVLLANKIDLVKEGGWGKSKAEMDQLCQDKGFVTWMETSAKEDTGIQEAIAKLVETVVETVSLEVTEISESAVDLSLKENSNNCLCSS